MSERQIKESGEDTDKVGRGPNIPDDWKRHIMDRALTEVNKPRMLLADEISKQMKESRDVKDRLPERESIAKLISKARNHPKSPPWHSGLLRDYPYLSAEAVRHILEAQKAMRAYFDEVKKHLEGEAIKKLELSPIDVRQALWVARLYDIVRKHVETDEPRELYKNIAPDDPNILFNVAFHYADYELLCDLTKIPCDTSELDAALCKSLQHFFNFVSKQNAQGLREKHSWFKEEQGLGKLWNQLRQAHMNG